MKTKRTAYNAITMIIQSFLISLLSLITTSLIIKNYGSDFNGVVATAAQITNLLLIIEGGVSLAVNVSLYQPFVDEDFKKINSIMSAAKKVFIKIGLIFFGLVIIVSLIYPLLIKSNLEYFDIFVILFLVLSASTFNLILPIRCQILFQVSQKEYKYTILGIIINFISSIITIVLVLLKTNMLWIRFSVFLFTITNGLMIYKMYKKEFPFINTKVKPKYEYIKGTKDIMVQKMTSVMYLSAPLLYISTFINTKVASVYAVYYSIYNILKMVLSSIIAAPLNGFGQFFRQKSRKDVYEKFKLYEYLVLIIASLLLSSIFSVILSFVKLYTANVTDINYIDKYISYMIGTMIFLEVIHIPAGNIINITSEFKISRQIQSSASIILIILLIFLGYFFGIYGVIGSMILTNCYLVYNEINYVHKKSFNSNIIEYIKPLFLNLLLIIVCVQLNQFIIFNIKNYMMFAIQGSIIFLMNSFIIICFNYIFFKKYLKQIYIVIKNLIKL